jgi:hypothetical protein
MLFEFLIPKRPISLQTKNRKNLQSWKNFVLAEARKNWLGTPCNGLNLHLTLVYLCDDDPVDVDNIIGYQHKAKKQGDIEGVAFNPERP